MGSAPLAPRGSLAVDVRLAEDAGIVDGRRAEYCEIIHRKTVVVYTSRNFHGLVSGSSVLASNRGKGTGWKFFRPPGVMAGFFVFAKRGLILSFRICSITDHREGSLSEHSAVNNLKASVDFVRLSLLVHGSLANVKLASETTISATLVAFHSGNKTDNDSRTDTASDVSSLFSLMTVFLPMLTIRSMLQNRLRGLTVW